MRVSTYGSYLTTSQSLGSAMQRVQSLQSKIGTGKAVTAWSDDAPAAAAIERYRAQEADWSSFGKVANDAKSWLTTADGTLQSMSSLMSRVKELAVSANSGSLSSASRKAIADEVDQIRTELRDLGNTTQLGRSLFGGFGASALSTAPDGTITYAGDDGAVKRQVSPTITVTANVSAKDIFGFTAGAGQDVFSTLSSLSSAIRSGSSTALSSIQGTLQARHENILSSLSQVGTTTNQVDTALTSGSTALQDLASRRSDLEDIDLADAVLQLSAAQASYTAALGAASKANLPSLADFLR
jgi:flagellar hook-associated protein 3 FlgL